MSTFNFSTCAGGDIVLIVLMVRVMSKNFKASVNGTAPHTLCNTELQQLTFPVTFVRRYGRSAAVEIDFCVPAH